jgi:signal transduction histidine kinase
MGNAPATRRARTRRTTTAIEETTATGTTTPGPDLRWIRMEVIDTGIGIAKDKLEVVFKPFGQVRIVFPKSQECFPIQD